MWSVDEGGLELELSEVDQHDHKDDVAWSMSRQTRSGVVVEWCCWMALAAKDSQVRDCANFDLGWEVMEPGCSQNFVTRSRRRQEAVDVGKLVADHTTLGFGLGLDHDLDLDIGDSCWMGASRT